MGVLTHSVTELLQTRKKEGRKTATNLWKSLSTAQHWILDGAFTFSGFGSQPRARISCLFAYENKSICVVASQITGSAGCAADALKDTASFRSHSGITLWN